MDIINIREALPTDARFIGEAVVTAITPSLCKESFDGEGHSIEDITDVFSDLAAREDTQYSYKNTLIATDEMGNSIGAIIGYDGARLYELRDVFMREASERLGMQQGETIPDETDESEYYLDTLAVLPEYRRRGIGAALLRAAAERARACGKPAGLLVDKDNPNARRLYEQVGFRYVGDRYFFGEMMDHMQMH